MRKLLWLGIALAAPLWSAASSAQVSSPWVTLSPPDGGFSIDFPGQPQLAQIPPKPKTHTRVWSVHSSQLLDLFGVTDYDQNIDAERELQLDVTNFLASEGGTLKEQHRLTFANAPDGPLPAVDFTFTDAAGPGESLVVVSGDRSYQIVVRAENGYDGAAATARVLQSFRITQPSRHWQGGQ